MLSAEAVEEEEQATPEQATPEQETPEPATPQPAEYRVWTHTSSTKGAGTQGRVSIQLLGREGSSGMQPLDAQHDGAFGRGQVGHARAVTCLTLAGHMACHMLVTCLTLAGHMACHMLVTCLSHGAQDTAMYWSHAFTCLTDIS